MKLRTVELDEPGKGHYIDVEIPDGSWIVTVNSLREPENLPESPLAPLPLELMSAGCNEGLEQLRDHLERELMATVSREPLNAQRYFLGYPKEPVDEEDGLPFVDCDQAHSYAVVANKPFCLLSWGTDKCFPTCGFEEWEKCNTARIITNGKRGGFPDVPRPEVIRGTGNLLWCRLSNLAAALQDDAMLVWRFYFHVALGNHWILGHKLPICRGNEPTLKDYTEEEYLGVPEPRWVEEVRREQPEYARYYRYGYPDKYPPTTPNQIWVPADWAMTACRLHYFGFKPAKVEE